MTHHGGKKGWRLALGVFCLALFIIGYAFAHHSSAADNRPAPTYVVQQGDTLWSIAKSHSSPEQDIRLIVYRIRKLNKLDSPVIYPGQCLLLPASP
ncbi:MAG: LysM peptidoglycan-binding domain-containing protein [Firmicutes bacterium]|nr:LysM peptidoglycan-binding domain-containing protein [Bacillota bacterium]